MIILPHEDTLRNLERLIDRKVEALRDKGSMNIVAYAYVGPDGRCGHGVLTTDNQLTNNGKGRLVPCKPPVPWGKTKLKNYYKMLDRLTAKGCEVISKEAHDADPEIPLF